jgi:hypothetical protein
MKYTPAKNLKPGDTIRLRGSALITQIDKLSAERDKLLAERGQYIAALKNEQKLNAKQAEMVNAQTVRIAELDEEIIRLKAENVQKDQEIANLKNSPAPVTPAVNPAPPVMNPVPAAPANPAVAPPATQTAPAVQQPAQPATPPPGVFPVRNPDGLSSAPPNPIPVIGGTENVAKNKKATTSDDWDKVLEEDFGIKAEDKSMLAKNK